MDFKYQIEREEQYVLIRLSGVLIAPDQTTGLIEDVQKLVERGMQNVIVELSGIETMNSTGLNMMISILTKTRNSGGEAIIANIPKKVNELMVITKLNTVFTVAETVAAGVELLKKEETWL